MARITYAYFLAHILTNSNLSKKKIYWAYQQTDRWQELRQARLELDKHRCRLCNAPATCVHHCRYPEIFGEETIDDLTSLCDRCHNNYHNPPGVEELKTQLLELAATTEGTVCPVCKTDCKIYNRSLYFNMVKHLIKLSRLPKDDDGFVQIGDEPLGKEEQRNYTAAEFQKLRYFGLIEKNQPGEQRDGVWWRVTPKGKDFISGKIKVPSNAVVLNGKVLSYSDNEISIVEALETPFNYEQLMAGIDITPPKQKRNKRKKRKKS